MAALPDARLPGRAPAAILRGMAESIRIAINGEQRAIGAGATVALLLVELGLDTRKVAVERNEAIVPRSTWQAAPLADGDRLEIVHFIGGG
jgi:thiamine biosynthesis protein ThiS